MFGHEPITPNPRQASTSRVKRTTIYQINTPVHAEGTSPPPNTPPQGVGNHHRLAHAHP
jgi:hypothetical protein